MIFLINSKRIFANSTWKKLDTIEYDDEVYWISGDTASLLQLSVEQGVHFLYSLHISSAVPQPLQTVSSKTMNTLNDAVAL